MPNELENTNPKAVEVLMGFLEDPINIAEQLDDDTLMKVGRDVMNGFDTDEGSMSEWVDIIEKGLDLIKPETQPKSEPWDNAANFKSPVIIDAQLRFGDLASAELLRGPDFMKTRVVGNDPTQQKAERSERVATYMNWQLTQQMTEWVKEQNKLIYDLAPIGASFKKTFFSRELQRNVSELITYPSFVINNDITSLERARRFSQKMEFSHNEVIERQRGGLWLDINLQHASGSDESVPDQTEDDKIDTFIEQHTFADLDEDGYEEPYIITVHKSSQQVVRIVPRFGPKDILLKDEKNQRSAVLADLIQPDGALPKTDGQREIIKITPQNSITQYGFLPAPDGGFLNVGYFHLLGGLNAALNVTTNALINAGNLANLQGGFLSRDMRQKLGNLKTKPGMYQQTQLSAQDLAQGIRDYNFKEPSPTLFQLNQLMLQTARETSSSVDLKGAIGANAPATTTLALVQEQQQSSSAIIQRIYRSEAEEFKKLYQLNGEFLDEAEYQRVVDDPEASIEDFNTEDFDIVPVANPEASSKIQRLQLAQVEMNSLQAVSAVGGNPKPIVENFLKAIGTQNIEDIFPKPTEEQQQQQQASQQQQLQEQELLKEMTIDHAERTQENEDAKTEAEVAKNQAQTVKALEEAETEQTKNLSDQYTTAFNLDQQALDLQQQINQPFQNNQGV